MTNDSYITFRTKEAHDRYVAMLDYHQKERDQRAEFRRWKVAKEEAKEAKKKVKKKEKTND